MKLTMDEVRKITLGVVRNDAEINRPITGLAIDSRCVKDGDLFVAIKGSRVDGHDFIRSAAENGAVAALVSREIGHHVAIPVIMVRDTIWAMGELARYWRNQMNVLITGITGSNGKTTVKEMLASILEISNETVKSEGNYNNLIGLPLTLARLEPGHDRAVVEMGTSRFGEIERLTQIAQPDIGVITNIGPSHLEFFGDLDGVAREKGTLIEHTEVAVLNADDEYVDQLAERASGKVLTFGFGEEADVRARDVSVSSNGRQSFELIMDDALIGRVELAVLGRHNLSNALAAACAALTQDVRVSDVIEGLAGFRPVEMRTDLLTFGDAIIVSDAYNANPSSFNAALDVLDQASNGRRKVAIVGDMMELGKDEIRFHEQVGRHIADHRVDLCVAVGERARTIADVLAQHRVRCVHLRTTEQAVERLPEFVRDDDAVLLKASRAMQFERILNRLREILCSTTSSSKN